MYEFELERPATLAAALAFLADDDAQALAGGQTLIPTLKQRLASPDTLVSLTDIPELRGIVLGKDGRLSIGATATHAQVAHEGAALYGALAEMAGDIGDPAVRNRGTLGGSLANNDPSACYPAAVLASNATVHTTSRDIAVDDFFDGLFATDLAENELITRVSFPVPLAASYQKFAQPASRFALVGVFVAKFPEGVRVAVTGASEDGVFRWAEAEEALSKNFHCDALKGLSVDPADMIADLHADQTYRAHLVNVITGRAVAAAA